MKERIETMTREMTGRDVAMLAVHTASFTFLLLWMFGLLGPVPGPPLN